MKTIWGIEIHKTQQIMDFLWGALKNIAVLFTYIAVTILVLKGIEIIVDKMFRRLIDATNEYEHKKQIATIKNLVKSLLKGISIILIILSFLGQYNIDVRPLLTAAGVVGVAVGFAARRFVEDVIMGVLILLEGQIRVGDFVNIDGMDGFVEKVTLKMVIIRNLNGHVHYIRNGMINIITNKTRGFAMPMFDIGVAYNSDIDKVIDVMKSVADELRKKPEFKKSILEDINVLGVQEFADSAIIIRAMMKTKPLEQWTVDRAYKKALKEAFDREGIEIPFPQRDVHMIKGE